MNPIERLRTSHPAFRNVTPETFCEYFALMVPHTIAYGYRLCHDTLSLPPCIHHLAGELGTLMIKQLAAWREDSAHYNALCAYMTDQALRTKDPRIRQVVILDMTMDSRAFYLSELAKCCVFEVHRNAVVLEEKETLLLRSGAKLMAQDRRVCLADPRKDGWQSALLAAGFDPEVPTFWVVASHLSYMSASSGSHLVSVLASLSAPHSQLYADMFAGHACDLARDGEPDLVVHGAAFCEMHGENAFVFQTLANWRVELLARRDDHYKYFGSMWESEKLKGLTTTDPEIGYLGPWFMVRFSKLEEA